MKTILATILITLSCNVLKAQSFINNWENGKYFTSEGLVIKGLISKEPKGNRPIKGEKYILFKADSNANKQWIPLSSLRSFIIFKGNDDVFKVDSFTVSRSSYAENLGYVKVLINNHYKIYRGTIRSTVAMMAGKAHITTNAQMDVYLFGTEPNNLTEITRGIFMDVMLMVMADKPEIVADIKKKEFKYGDMDELIQYYKTGVIDIK